MKTSERHETSEVLKTSEVFGGKNPTDINSTDIIPQSHIRAVRVLPLYNKCRE